MSATQVTAKQFGEILLNWRAKSGNPFEGIRIVPYMDDGCMGMCYYPTVRDYQGCCYSVSGVTEGYSNFAEAMKFIGLCLDNALEQKILACNQITQEERDHLTSCAPMD